MFNQLAGNQRVKDLLQRMLQSQRVPGALLLTGEEGIGKKLFAVELAKALNCRAKGRRSLRPMSGLFTHLEIQFSAER
jgi:DNA polymerase-3 subunit delta'